VAELTAFGYQLRQSFLHRCDARVKIGSLLIVSSAGLYARGWGLMVLTAAAAAAFLCGRQPLWRTLRELRWFFILLAAILASRAIFTPGRPLAQVFTVAVSSRGLVDGVLVCWRLLLIVLSAMVLTATTRASEIRAAVQWFFAPVPFVPEKRLGTMLGLLVRLIPLIFGRISEVRCAQLARCVDCRKNPIYRMRVLVVPLMERLFDAADELVLAMTARAYHENRSGPTLQAGRSDWLVLSAIAAAGLVAVIV